MKEGTNLGTIVPVVESMDALFEMVFKDSCEICKDIEKVLGAIDLRVGYDREVLVTTIAHTVAVAIISLEKYDDTNEKNLKHQTEKFLKYYREEIQKNKTNKR